MYTKVKNNAARLNRLLLAIGIFMAILLAIFSLRNQPLIVEQYYSSGLYIFLRKTFLFIYNYIPFSVGDILYIAIVLFLIVGFIKFIRLIIRKKITEAGLFFLSFLLKIEIAITLFYGLWAVNYFRQPAAERLDLTVQYYNSAELVNLTSMLIDSANKSRAVLSPADLLTPDSEILGSATKAIIELENFRTGIIVQSPAAKPSLLSPLMNYLGTAGYFNPFTGEAQFNNNMPVFNRPFVACHEMAHQIGFGAEDDANFAGFIAGKSSENKLLKYSAYYAAAQEFMHEVWRTDSISFKNLKNSISVDVIRDLESERAYWTKYQGSAARLSSIFYDNYLKVNKQPGGLKTYNKMIKLSVAYYRREGFFR